MKILVIEDEVGISNFLSQGLEEEGFSVEVAPDGLKGLEKATNKAVDLILLDWMLPGISGLEVCKKLERKIKQYQ